MTAGRTPPYSPGGGIKGLVNDGAAGTVLSTGNVISCTWDDRLGSWRVKALMRVSDGKKIREYLWVDDSGESDYCHPGVGLT